MSSGKARRQCSQSVRWDKHQKNRVINKMIKPLREPAMASATASSPTCRKLGEEKRSPELVGSSV